MEQVTNVASADKVLLERGSGGSTSEAYVTFADFLLQLGLEVIAQEKTYRITFADSPFTVPYDAATVYADSTDGAITINLKAVKNGITCNVIRENAGANDVTVACADNISGAATSVLNAQYDFKTYKSNGLTYFVK